MQFDSAKLQTAILYTCSRCDPAQLGAVKLHKVLYFADMLHYVDVGCPISGATYRKRPLGPTCDQLLPTLNYLERSGAIRVNEVDYFGYRKKEYIAVKEPELDRLSESERGLLDEVIEFVCFNNTAKTISEFSHKRPWELAQFGDVLTYNSAFHLFPTQVSPENLEWAEKEGREIEAARPEKDTVAGEPFGALRARVLAGV